MGVESSVTPEKLKVKYFELVKIYHPDRVKSSIKASQHLMRENHPQLR